MLKPIPPEDTPSPGPKRRNLLRKSYVVTIKIRIIWRQRSGWKNTASRKNSKRNRNRWNCRLFCCSCTRNCRRRKSIDYIIEQFSLNRSIRLHIPFFINYSSQEKYFRFVVSLVRSVLIKLSSQLHTWNTKTVPREHPPEEDHTAAPSEQRNVYSWHWSIHNEKMLKSQKRRSKNNPFH